LLDGNFPSSQKKRKKLQTMSGEPKQFSLSGPCLKAAVDGWGGGGERKNPSGGPGCVGAIPGGCSGSSAGDERGETGGGASDGTAWRIGGPAPVVGWKREGAKKEGGKKGEIKREADYDDDSCVQQDLLAFVAAG